jgi:tetratricopeptide (TPR) repeat protein
MEGKAAMRAGMAELTDYERAQVHFEMNDYMEAARLLEPFAAEQPHSVSVRLLLARAYYHSAQLRRAEDEFRAVTEIDPVEDYAWFALGRTLERQGRHGEAGPCFRLAAAMRPSPDYLDAEKRADAIRALSAQPTATDPAATEPTATEPAATEPADA